MARIFFRDEDEPLDIRRDSVFKAIFARDNEISRGALSGLVSALIGRDLAIVAITTNEPPVDDIRDRQIRYDISCKAQNGELVNIEMSLNPESFEPIRLEFYAGKLLTRQDIRGVNYDYNNLKQSYQIAILAQKRFFPDKIFFHTFEYYDPANKVSLKGKNRIITLELSKLEKVVEKPVEAMNEQEHWAVFFGYLTDKGKRRKINEIMEKEEGIAMASEAIITITDEDREWAWQLSREKYLLDTQSVKALAWKRGMKKGLKEGEKKGLEKGEKKGLKKGREEIARKMKAIGRPLEEIVEVTGLPPETVEKL